MCCGSKWIVNKQQKLLYHCSGGWEVLDQDLADLISEEDLLSGS
jgi:hypothetical protein